MGIGRLELPTSPLSGARSSHLSYMPMRPRHPAAADGFRDRAAAVAQTPYSANPLATEQCVGRLGENDERLPIDLRAFATNEQLAPPPRDPARP